MPQWRPRTAAVFHYDDDNPEREQRHQRMIASLGSSGATVQELVFTEASAVKSVHDNMELLRGFLLKANHIPIVLDMSVLTKRHLLMMLRWIDDVGFWDQLFVVYTQPETYEVSEFIPLSFGLRSFEQIPGFAACPDLSRPVHLVLFLGYEGDRALAAYEHVEPLRTTIVFTDPPFKPEWRGRAEFLNRDLLALLKSTDVQKIDGIDPEESMRMLQMLFEQRGSSRDFAKIICPIGTKPQALGTYLYVRRCKDPPAIVYASPLRHNHRFFSKGAGPSWILKNP
ncbi:MAG: hypothetical protein M3Y27_28590 [Acidobacteriota bacterium]|nr:hypothetical protein [Acidobacteriota bacterium]